jgi:rod shape-determining protein MreC
VPRPARTDPRVDLAILAACGATAFVCLVLPTTTRDNAAASLRSSVVAPLAALQEKAELSRRSFLAHDAAVKVADSVTLRSLRLGGVEEENERLRSLLGLASALKWGFIPAEALQGRGMGDETTIALSAGRLAGVEPLSPVVVAEGLVGMVERVDNSLSLAIVWPHPDFRVSSMAADGSAFGIVRAHPGTGASRYYLELQGVPLRSTLKAGTLIVASGLGNVYPKGIPIGTVMQELRTPEGYARSYLVRPAVRLQDVNSVMILKPERVRAGLTNVWVRVAAADSATKGAVAAGDSLLRTKRDSAARDAAKALAPKGALPATPSVVVPGTPAPKAIPLKRDTLRRDTLGHAP